MISRPSRLRREHFSLAIEQEQTAFIPFEDIAVIVLNHREINLSHPVLSACAEYGISLFSTGDNHQPSGVFLPFLPHSRTHRVLRLQLDIARPLAKQAWASIVRRKIENQAACLRLAGRDGIGRHHVRPVDKPGNAPEALRLALREVTVAATVEAGKLGVVVGSKADACFQNDVAR
ncbi:MAG: CRISPR-associated endonuclease Cas1 [Betaproteobacteria bacterium]|nr:CRISPR-associated endonuclease Cas1 [Betaproteobacteria bacterium]